ncbi:hypothetical protein D1007_02284 [Hordeum vulgare]|nr:hypothetical protein D1007_02284 [Hordeum vulgare]
MVAARPERKFTIIVKVDTHNRRMNLSVVYTNDSVVVENSINTMEQLLAEHDKYRVVDFDLEYTNGRVSYDQKVVVPSCVCAIMFLSTSTDWHKALRAFLQVRQQS